jgi:hypothetical protein
MKMCGRRDVRRNKAHVIEVLFRNQEIRDGMFAQGCPNVGYHDRHDLPVAETNEMELSASRL